MLLCIIGILFFVLIEPIQINAQSDIMHIAQTEGKTFKNRHRATRNASGVADIQHATLRLNLDPAVTYISGSVSFRFKDVSERNSLEFDLSDSLTVDSIIYHSQSINFQHEQHVVRINLPQTLAVQQIDSVSIWYHGVPRNGEGFGSFVRDEHDGVPVIWTLSEPYGARDWWPCLQQLSDKIDSLDVYITTPEMYTAVSNGILQSTQNVSGQKTFHWRHRYPIVTYLVCVAVTNYTTYSNFVGRLNDTLEV